MSRVRYVGGMTDKDVLRLLREGEYRVDPSTGTLYGPRGFAIAPWSDPNEGGRMLVRVYYQGRRRGISLAKLVWMSVAKRVVPNGFEIHHRDEDLSNNTWDNLYCLFTKDHKKLHNRNLLVDNTEYSDEVPF